MERFSAKRFVDHHFVWDRKFATRQQLSYRLEESLITPQQQQSLVDAFLSKHKSRLDPPQYNCTALKSFLETAKEAELTHNPPHPDNAAKIVLIDDRRDPTGWLSAGEHHGARDWNGYDRYPPEGSSQYSAVLNAVDLYERLLVKVSYVFWTSGLN